MKRLSFLLIVIALSSTAHAQDCKAEKIFWDSDGNSPYITHAECVGNLNAATAGSSQTAQALTNEEAGGVGFATFQCIDGVWKIDNSRFNTGYDSNGYCAD